MVWLSKKASCTFASAMYDFLEGTLWIHSAFISISCLWVSCRDSLSGMKELFRLHCPQLSCWEWFPSGIASAKEATLPKVAPFSPVPSWTSLRGPNMRVEPPLSIASIEQWITAHHDFLHSPMLFLSLSLVQVLISTAHTYNPGHASSPVPSLFPKKLKLQHCLSPSALIWNNDLGYLHLPGALTPGIRPL